VPSDNRPDPSLRAELLSQFQQTISGLGSDELRDVLQRLLAAGTSSNDPFARTPPPSGGTYAVTTS
jgi:hypothetical protein